MKAINNWPLGSAKLVRELKEIPKPRKLIGILGGYCFYKTRYGNTQYKNKRMAYLHLRREQVQ